MEILDRSKPLKVAVLYSGGRSLGGIETYLINLIKGVDKNQVNIDLLSLGEWPLTERLQVLGIRPKIFSGSRINLKSVLDIGKYCKKNRISLLVSQGTVSNAYARLVSKYYKIPNLVTVHSDASSEYTNTIKRSVYWLIDRTGRSVTNRYIVVSKYLRSVLAQSGISNNNMDVIYNGSDYPKPKSRDHKRLVIGTLGRLNQVKGYDLLIKAFALLENKRLRLKIAGEGEELDNLKQLAKSLGVVSRVEFVGYRDDVFKFLNSIDIYAQSSRCEGFGVGLAQAMSQNLPVVVTPAGSLKELVTDGQTGYISNDMSPESIAATLSYVVGHIVESTKVGENAGQFVNENFTTEKWINETTEAYFRAVE